MIYILRENYIDTSSILGLFDSLQQAQSLSGLSNWRTSVSGNKWIIANRGDAIWWSIEALPLNVLLEEPWK